MITNKQIDLSKNSSVRIDAINTIKYTLLLNYKIPDYDNNELQFIDNIFKNCHECCYRLFFNDSPENFQKNFRYNFFGIIPFPNKTQSLFDSVGVLPAIYDDSTSYGENTFDFSYKSPPLHQLLLNHCIMSSYHAIVTELQKYDLLTSYSIAKGNHLSIIYSKQNNTLNKIADSNAANFQKKTKKRLSVLPFVSDLATIDKESIQPNNDNNKDQKSVLFFKQFTELLYTICSIHQTPFNYFFKENKTKNRIKNYTVLCNNISSICNEQNQYYDSKTHLFKNRIPECIYNSYLFERIFNFRLFYSTINLIQYINKQQQYRLDINDFVSAFSLFTSLPNVFSRQLLLTYATIHIDKSTCSHKDFWYFHDLYKHKSQDDEMLFPTSSAFELYKWKEQLELFTQYLSKFIIPIYEWCFIGMLFDSIEIEQEKHKQKTLDPYTENLKTAKSILETYMEKNQADLIHPFSNYSQIKNPSLKDAIDIVSPIETPCGEYELETFFPEKFSSLPINFTNELYKAFFQSPKTFDLNLTKNLNPSYFSNIIDSNQLRGHEKVNLLYIDLLKTSFKSNNYNIINRNPLYYY